MKALPFNILLLLMMLSGIALRSQNEATKWYFGYNAGLDFSTSPPTPLNNSAMYTWEGCASIADPGTGQLLFYTDGLTVWNANHVPMANGTGLFGNGSTTQSAIIVKQPGNINLYYIFTLDLQGSAQGLCYSIVDMSLVAGTGSVTTKNVFLYNYSTEKLTAVKSCNGSDVWIVSHKMGNSEFRSYLLSASGVSTTPVISNIGPLHFPMGQGYLRAASNGKKLACAQSNGNPSTLELYDFDPMTGVVSNSLLVSNSIGNSWGVEFSPDCSKLYCGTIGNNGAVYQWNLCAGSTAAILASSVVVSTATGNFPCLQNGPDGKIYIAQWGTSSLSVINNPNALGTACNYTSNAIALTTGTCTTGLPNFICSFRTLPSFNYTVNPLISCNTATFAVPSTPLSGCAANNYSVNSYNWVFDDGSTGALNTSTLTNPVHVFSHGGTFKVKLAVIYNCGVDTIRQNVTIVTPQAIIQSTNVTCSSAGTSTVAMQSPGSYNYTWMPGNVSGSVAPTGPGIYTVFVNQTNSVCAFNTTFQVAPPVPLTATVSTSVTCGSPGTATIQVTPGSGANPQFTYLWNGSPGSSTIAGLQSGGFTVVAIQGSCSVSKVFTVMTGPPISISMPPPSSVCCLIIATFTASASGGSGNFSYLWAHGPTTASFVASMSNAGPVIYTLTITDASSCTASGTMQVTYVAPPSLTVTSFTVCPKTVVTLTASGALSYSWTPGGQITSTISNTYNTNTTYTIKGTGINNCTSTITASVKLMNCTGIQEEDLSCFSISPNPCLDFLKVSSASKGTVCVKDVDGRTVIEKKIEGSENIDVSNLATGIYFVTYFNETVSRSVRLVKSTP